jgi:hypothetical protein
MRVYHIPSWDHLLVCGQYEGATSHNIVMLRCFLLVSVWNVELQVTEYYIVVSNT